jgi:hypothetical protein
MREEPPADKRRTIVLDGCMFIWLFLTSCLHQKVTGPLLFTSYQIRASLSRKLPPPHLQEREEVVMKVNLSPVAVKSDESYILDAEIFCQVEPTSDAAASMLDEELLFTTQLRVFSHAELLAIEERAELAESGCSADFIDLVLVLLFPNPPALKNREEHSSTIRWTSITASGYHHHVRATWSIESLTREESTVLYQGPWSLKGAHNVKEGQLSGTVKLQRAGGLPLQHHIEAARSVCSEKAQEVCEEQLFELWLERL